MSNLLRLKQPQEENSVKVKKDKKDKKKRRERINIDLRTAPIESPGRELHPVVDRGMTIHVPSVHLALTLTTRDGDLLRVRLEMTTDVDEAAAPTLPPGSGGRKTVCSNGHCPTSRTGSPPLGGTETGPKLVTTVGSDKGAEVHPVGSHHRRGQGPVHLPRRLRLSLRRIAPHGWL